MAGHRKCGFLDLVQGGGKAPCPVHHRALHTVRGRRQRRVSLLLENPDALRGHRSVYQVQVYRLR